MNLVRAELLKIRTTPLWWIFAIIAVPLWAAAVGLNWLSANFTTQSEGMPDAGDNSLEAQQLRAAGAGVNVAASLYTSGQFFGLLLVLLLAALVMTSEYFHQTTTTTFLITPVRSQVIIAKLVAAALIAVAFWLVTTVLNLIVTPLILASLDLPTYLGNSATWQAIGLNGLAFALWAILGVGAGVLIRSQLAATITLSVVYLVGTAAVGIFFTILASNVAEWIAKLEVIVPTTASALMVSGTDLPGNPPRWVGAAVLLGYAVIMGVIGTALARRRDIS
jgi:ABC-type transport system involved in multi-copper enzyme maturation permease subunit